MRDEEIIDLYFRRDEMAITETDNKYGNYCEKIAGNILKDNLDVEECVNDTYLKTWNKIPPTRPKIFKAFLAKITRELAFDRYRSLTSKKRGNGVIEEVLEELKECIPDHSDVEQEILGGELAVIVRDFVNSLSEKEAFIFLSRYFYAEDLSSISKKFDMSKNNVSVTLGRLRRRLQNELVKEGYLAS